MTSGDINFDLNNKLTGIFSQRFLAGFRTRFRFLATTSGSRVRRGFAPPPPPPIRWWKIQRAIRARVNCIALLKPTRETQSLFASQNLCACLPCCSPASGTRTSRLHFSSSPRDRRYPPKHSPRMLFFFVISHQVCTNNYPALSCLGLPDLL